MDSQSRKTGVAALSIASNTALTIVKLVVGLLVGSVSVISEAIHSGVDLLAAIIAWFAVRTADRPADEVHPFGHGKYENISGTIEALLIFMAAAWIVYEAVKKFVDPEPLESVGLGVLVMGISGLVNIIISSRLFKIGRETDSVALEADAWHLRTDVYTSAGVMVGLLIVWIGRSISPQTDLHWVDPAAAIVVALLIVRAAYQLTIKAARDLLDVTLPAEEQKWILDRVRVSSPMVHGMHKLRTRKSGSHRFIQFHLLVHGEMSVEESHNLHDQIVVAVKEHFDPCDVVIHIEPCACESEDKEVCLRADEEG